MKTVVIWEHENFRSRTNKRYQIMNNMHNGGLHHLFPGICYTLEEAKRKCEECGYKVEKIGTFYEII